MSSDKKEIEELCFASLEAAVKRLCTIGVWPRPIRSRNLQVGKDIFHHDFKKIPELTNFIELLASKTEIRVMYLNEKYFEASKRTLVDVWLCLLLNVLTETSSSRINKQVFQKWFNRFLDDLYSETALWRCIYVFNGLELRGKHIQLDESTEIIPISKNKLSSLIPWYEKYYDLTNLLNPVHTLSPSGNAVLVITKNVKKKYNGSSWPSAIELKGRERAVTALTAIRLISPGYINIKFFGLFQVSEFRMFLYIGLDEMPDFELNFHDPNIKVKENDISKIKTLWNKLVSDGYGEYNFNKEYAPSAMEIARERFLKSYEDEDWSESLLDLTISLEALFNPSDNQELRHRIAMRCAWLLGNDRKNAIAKNKSQNIFNCVHKLYDLRSSIVHGNQPGTREIQKFINTIYERNFDEKDRYTMYDLAIEIARDIVRRSIRACSNLESLPHDGPHWPFSDDFDKEMISSNKKMIWQKAARIFD